MLSQIFDSLQNSLPFGDSRMSGGYNKGAICKRMALEVTEDKSRRLSFRL